MGCNTEVEVGDVESWPAEVDGNGGIGCWGFIHCCSYYYYITKSPSCILFIYLWFFLFVYVCLF